MRSIPLSSTFRLCCALAVALVAFPAPASAHHLMGGRLPASAFEGLLSGVSHPIIGVDHLLVILAAGMLSARVRRGLWVPAAFVLASLLGTVMHLMRLDLVAVAAVVAGSMVCFGAALAVWRRGGLEAWLVLAVGSGIFHGYSYAESIVGAEPAPLVAYLAGFTMIQLVIAASGRALALAALRSPRLGAVSARAFGTAMSVAGIVLLAKALIGRG
jgi:urease accessory protein